MFGIFYEMPLRNVGILIVMRRDVQYGRRTSVFGIVFYDDGLIYISDGSISRCLVGDITIGAAHGVGIRIGFEIELLARVVDVSRVVIPVQVDCEGAQQQGSECSDSYRPSFGLDDDASVGGGYHRGRGPVFDHVDVLALVNKVWHAYGLMIIITNRMDELVELRNTNYYMLVNKATRTALSLNFKAKNIEKEEPTLAEPNQEDLSQVWMIVQVAPDRHPNKYQIVHTFSTLVLTSEKPDEMRVRFGKWKHNQLYFLHRHDPKNHPNQFYIKTDKDSNKYLHFNSKVLACSQVDMNKDRSNCIWEIVLVHHNSYINQSCYIECAFSNMVLDVPQASQKSGTKICQYPCNNRFNQRWKLVKQVDTKFGQCFEIVNLRNGLSLDVKGESKKPGTPIIQYKSTKKDNQLWAIEYQGKNIYMIRSMMDKGLYMGVKDNSLKQCADIVITDDESQCFWKIIGHIPQ